MSDDLKRRISAADKIAALCGSVLTPVPTLEQSMSACEDFDPEIDEEEEIHEDALNAWLNDAIRKIASIETARDPQNAAYNEVARRMAI